MSVWRRNSSCKIQIRKISNSPFTDWSLTFISIIHKNLVPTWQKTHFGSITCLKPLMLIQEIIAFLRGSYVQCVKALCAKMKIFLTLHQVVHQLTLFKGLMQQSSPNVLGLLFLCGRAITSFSFWSNECSFCTEFSIIYCTNYLKLSFLVPCRK